MPAERSSSVENTKPEPTAGQQESSMAEMFEQYLSFRSLERGEIVSGTIIQVQPKGIIVDVGAKCEGFVPNRDLEETSSINREALQEGDEVLVCVVNAEDADDGILLSISQAQVARDWRKAQRLLESQETVEMQATGYNKGGMLVEFGAIRGFVPGSQLASSRSSGQGATDAKWEDQWAEMVGQTLQLKVIEVDRERNRLILSERAALKERRKSQRDKILKELTKGDVRRGRVTNLVDFGAFVDLGGIDGLVHLSELSWKRVSHPSEVLEMGQEVEVYVLNVERERQRVALSLKRLQPDPWDSVEEEYQEGQLVEGTITNLTKWGAFASIVGNEAIEGLIHISELDNDTVVHPRDVVQPGQVVTLRVIGLDAERHRLSLSLKQVDEGEFMEQDWRTALEAEQPEPESPISTALSEAIESASEASDLMDTEERSAPQTT